MLGLAAAMEAMSEVTVGIELAPGDPHAAEVARLADELHTELDEWLEWILQLELAVLFG